MANIYSGMTSAEKDNERKYLNNLVSGGGGNAEWAKNQLKDLDAASSSSKSSSKGSSSNYETWDSGGRTYVNGIDVGPAGTKIDTSDATVSAAYSGAYSGGNSTQNNRYDDAYMKALQDRYDALEYAGGTLKNDNDDNGKDFLALMLILIIVAGGCYGIYKAREKTK